MAVMIMTFCNVFEQETISDFKAMAQKELIPNEADAVDLGLPSGMKYANINVGASKPENYVSYFLRGEVE